MEPEDKKISAVFYKSDSGNEPVKDWLRSLPKEERRVIGEDIKTVEKGWPIGMPLTRHLKDGVHEVRSELPSKIARVLFFVSHPFMILLHGFFKKTQTTPPADLKLALRRKRKFEKEASDGSQ